jgi:hypothetical protein
MGTTMLAMKTIVASAHDPEVQRNTTPLRIVSDCALNKVLVTMTGKRTAGI